MGYMDKSQPSFNDWMSQNGVTSDMYNGYDYTGQKGLRDTYNNIYNPNAGLSGNSYMQYMNDPALGGLGIGLTKGGLQDIGMGANLLGTGYDLYSNLFGDKHDMFKTQMGALKQNMANIAQDRANHQTYVKNIGGGFNSAFGNGLAANSAARVG